MTQIQRIRSIIDNPFLRPSKKLADIAEIVRRKRVYRCEGKTADLKAYFKARYSRLREAGLCRDCEQPCQKSCCATCAQKQKTKTATNTTHV